MVLHRLRGLDLELAHRLHDAWSGLDREQIAVILHARASVGELAEHGEDADPEFVRAMLVGPVASGRCWAPARRPRPPARSPGWSAATLQR